MEMVKLLHYEWHKMQNDLWILLDMDWVFVKIISWVWHKVSFAAAQGIKFLCLPEELLSRTFSGLTALTKSRVLFLPITAASPASSDTQAQDDFEFLPLLFSGAFLLVALH